MYFSLKNKVKDDKELEMYLDAFSDDAQTVVRTRRAETGRLFLGVLGAAEMLGMLMLLTA